VIKTLQSPKNKDEIAQESSDREEKTSNERWTIRITGSLALIALGQLGIYWYQAIKLRDTVNASADQSRAMNRHIEEAERSADAMETIAKTIESGNKMIMRAYLTVSVGDIQRFEERKGVAQEDLRFETRPNLTNTGNTQARNVGISIVADILP